jgi:hypothetical protein
MRIQDSHDTHLTFIGRAVHTVATNVQVCYWDMGQGERFINEDTT